MNTSFEYLGIAAMVIFIFETSIYLAYYKDVIFAMITLLNYVGMYVHNYDKTKKTPID
jgi:hypothetical protein